MKQKIKILLLFIIALFLLFWFQEFRFSEKNSITAFEDNKNIRIISSTPSHFGKIVAYESLDSNIIGIDFLKIYLGFIIKKDSSFYFNVANDTDECFSEYWAFSKNKKNKQQYVSLIKVRDKKIKYISIGQNPSLKLPNLNNLSLNDVKKQPKIYNVGKVVNDYVLFVIDTDSTENNFIRAFDIKGDLVAYKLPSSPVYYN